MSILLILAFVCFLLAMVGVPTGGRINLVALGLALWVAAQLWPRAGIIGAN
jgi:hypothetical protein